MVQFLGENSQLPAAWLLSAACKKGQEVNTEGCAHTTQSLGSNRVVSYKPAPRSWSGNFPECHRTTRGQMTETQGQRGHEDDEAFRHYFEAQWCTGSELALTMGTRSSF